MHLYEKPKYYWILRDIQQIARTSFLPWCQVLLSCSELKKKLTIVAISMRFVRMRSRRLVGCMFVRPMPSCKSGIFMRCSVFPVASLLSFSYAPPGWPRLPCVWRRTVAAFRCPCSVRLCARHRNAVFGCRSFLP